ncbi:hypothetical protein VUR80DRAFT_6207 [Thermomyces stellatus]
MTYEGRSTGLTSLSPELILRVIDHSDSQSRCRWPAPRNTSPTAAAASSTAIRLPTGSTASHPTWILRSVLGYEDPFEPWHDGKLLQCPFLEEEVERLLGVFGKEMDDKLRGPAEEGLRAGKDWFLKAVLLALLPRLVYIKVAAGINRKALAWLAHSMS